jgi:hypothetical protein
MGKDMRGRGLQEGDYEIWGGALLEEKDCIFCL